LKHQHESGSIIPFDTWERHFGPNYGPSQLLFGLPPRPDKISNHDNRDNQDRYIGRDFEEAASFI
jgi:hypothetical protein